MTALAWPRSEGQRLMAGCLLALAVHAVLLFGVSIRSEPLAPRTLEVTLVTLPYSQAPWEAQALAPDTQHGSGQGPKLRAQAAHSAGMIEVPGIRSAEDASLSNPSSLRPGSSGQQGSAAAGRNITTTADSWRHDSADTPPQPGSDAERRLIRREQPGTLSKDAEFNQAAIAPGRPNERLPVAPDARRDPNAAYIDVWRREVERVGSANFPWDALAMGRSNSLVLTVTIRADGSVADARIERSSGLPMLDRAALNILAMAAPFPAFPETLRRDSSQIRFSYVWEFLPGDSATRGAALRVGAE